MDARRNGVASYVAWPHDLRLGRSSYDQHLLAYPILLPPTHPFAIQPSPPFSCTSSPGTTCHFLLPAPLLAGGARQARDINISGSRKWRISSSDTMKFSVDSTFSCNLLLADGSLPFHTVRLPSPSGFQVFHISTKDTLHFSDVSTSSRSLFTSCCISFHSRCQTDLQWVPA